MAPFESLNERFMPDWERVLWVAGVYASCWAIFALTWWYSSNQGGIVQHTFRKFNFKDRCDWCSRVPSVIHATIVLCIIWPEHTMNVVWNEWFQTTDDLTSLELANCVSAGYFLYDLTLILISKMDMWQIFVFHHVAAMWPLMFCLFFGCERYLYFSTSYFFVEMTIVPLQLVHWCETLKRPDHWLASVGYHLTFWLWIPFRLIGPVYWTINGIFVVMPASDDGFLQCKLPVGQGGACIWLFCWAIFLLHVGPGYYKRVVLGEKLREKEAPAKKTHQAAAGARRAKEVGSPLSPMMSPTFKNVS